MAKLSKSDGKIKGYAVEVTGQYYGRNEAGVKSLKFYKKERFLFPEIVTYSASKESVERIINGMARSVSVPKVERANALRVCLFLIKNYYIEDRLKEKYADFVSVRTIEIFSKEELMIDADLDTDLAKKPIKEMTKSELAQTVTIHDLNITLANYADLGDMKLAVEHAIKQKGTDDVAAGKTEAMSEEAELLTEPKGSSLFG